MGHHLGQAAATAILTLGCLHAQVAARTANSVESLKAALGRR